MAKNSDIIRKQQKAIIAEITNMVTIMGTEAKNHFTMSFRNQGFTDASLQRWKERKRNKKGIGRAILVKSGDLRRSIRIVSKNHTHVIIGSDLPYARVHNDGLTIQKGESSRTIGFRDVSTNIQTGVITRRFAKIGARSRITRATSTLNVTIGAHSITMPKRQFIGDSRQLTNKLRIKLHARMQKFTG